MAKLLIVEDDDDLREQIRLWLVSTHYVVETAATGTDGPNLMTECYYDLIILDWQLPGMSGLDVCKKYRALGNRTPILLLTGKNTLIDKTLGLDSGADDYLTKPFDVHELSARIRSLLRRCAPDEFEVLEAGKIKLIPTKRTVSVDGQNILLMPKEFDLLEYMMRHPRQVFSTQALLMRIWGTDAVSSQQAVFSCIKRLRKKLDPDNGDAIIHSVSGVGYEFIPPSGPN